MEHRIVVSGEGDEGCDRSPEVAALTPYPIASARINAINASSGRRVRRTAYDSKPYPVRGVHS